ncbi:MAG: GNAT family N-acetyltransferase [Eubacteriales bacterium]|nr:GNAT family N-acetyltransferase [Eubacteriales bacterium]
MLITRVAEPAQIAHLFAGWPDTLIRSMLEGCTGEAYANVGYTAAQIVNGDFAFLAGDASCAEAAALAAHIPDGFGRNALLLSARDADWLAVAEAAWGNRAMLGERYAFCKDVHHFDPSKLRAFTEMLPPGVRLAPVNSALYRRALDAEWSRDLVNQFRDEADFLARGLGVMALEDAELVAGAASYAVFSAGIEVEIDTRPDRRRRGLARACGAALILTCLQRGLFPAWDAANLASAALAEQLGYVPAGSYPILVITLHP